MNTDQLAILSLVAVAIFVGVLIGFATANEPHGMQQCNAAGGTLVMTVDGYQCLPIKPIAIGE